MTWHDTLTDATWTVRAPVIPFHLIVLLWPAYASKTVGYRVRYGKEFS